MAFNLVIKVDGAEKLARQLTTVAAVPKDLSKEFDKVGEILRKEWGQNFDSEGRPTKWADLQPATVKSRGSAHPIGNHTGKLKESISGDGQYTVNVVQKQYAAFGVSGWAAFILHKGKWNQVDRPILHFSDKARQNIMKVFIEKIRSVIKL